MVTTDATRRRQSRRDRTGEATPLVSHSSNSPPISCQDPYHDVGQAHGPSHHNQLELTSPRTDTPSAARTLILRLATDETARIAQEHL